MQFNQLGNWRLLDRQGNPLALKVAGLKKEGFQLARNYEYELAEFNVSGAEAALPYNLSAADMTVPTTAPVIRQTGVKKAPNANKTNEVNMAAKMLRYWYNQADSETRKRFKKWINQ